MRTYTLTVDAVGGDEPIVIQSPEGCDYVILREQKKAGTVDFGVRAPTSSSPRVGYPAGDTVTLTPNKGRRGRFVYQETIGYISTDSGSVTFDHEEHD